MLEITIASFVILIGLSGVYFFANRLYKRPFFLYLGIGWLLNALYLPVEKIYWAQPDNLDGYFFSYWASLPTSICFYLAYCDLTRPRSLYRNFRSLTGYLSIVIFASIVSIVLAHVGPPLPFVILVTPGVIFAGVILLLLGKLIFSYNNQEMLSFLKRDPQSTAINKGILIQGLSSSPSSSYNEMPEPSALADLTPESARSSLDRSRKLFALSFFVYGALQPLYFAKPWYGDSPLFLIPFSLAFLAKIANGLGVAFLLLGDFRAVAEIFRLQSLTSELGVLTASVEHDIRNPLSSLQKIIDLLRLKYQHDSYLMRHVADINRQLDRISVATDVIPQFRETEDFYRQRFRKWDIVEILRTAAKYVRENRKGSSVRIDVSSRKSKIEIQVFRERLLQAFTNILTNSIESYQGSHKKPNVQVYCDIEGASLMIHFRDEGRGIPKEILPFVTAPLFSTKQDQKVNRGLGLFTAEHFVKQHGGSVDFSSDGQSFTDVIVCLPLNQSETEERI